MSTKLTVFILNSSIISTALPGRALRDVFDHCYYYTTLDLHWITLSVVNISAQSSSKHRSSLTDHCYYRRKPECYYRKSCKLTYHVNSPQVIYEMKQTKSNSLQTNSLQKLKPNNILLI